jgi:hypothetical protein
MPIIIDIDKLTDVEIAKLPSFIGIREISKTKAELLLTEDAEYISSMFKHISDEVPDLSDPNYWKNYHKSCEARLSPTKVLKEISGKKRKKGYWTKYNLRKMMQCPSGHRCTDPGSRCRAINRHTNGGAFGCGCRPPSDKAGNY